VRRLGVVAQKFIRKFPELEPALAVSSQQLGELLHDLVDPLALSIDAIVARPKSLSSVIQKTIDKPYGQPARQMTDLVGARVVTLYAADVDLVVDALKDTLDVDRDKSVDKRTALTLKEFGYRSVHLVASARTPDQTRYPALRDRRFEIQVRSLLEHSWAEIEHQVVYKSGVTYAGEFRRKFAALAAVIEMLDGTFLEMRTEQLELRQAYAEAYEAGVGLDETLDAARLAGLMSSAFPNNPGWRPTGTSAAISPDLSRRLVQGLMLTGATTARSLRDSFSDPVFKRRVRRYAVESGRAVDEVSHGALVLLALATRDASLFTELFPMEARNPPFATAMAS
jgi:ppGpp synthetase/RelA/SpoT-type nucleotidyltranferase